MGQLGPTFMHRDLLLDFYKHAYRKTRKLQSMPLGILRSMSYGACKTLSNLLEEAEHYVLSFSLHDTPLWLERNTTLKITVAYRVIYI
jgi:hypothetical protein